MNDIIKKDIFSVLRNTLKAVLKDDLLEIRNQSDRTIHNSSTFQDKYSITTAVVIYSLYKILEKNKFRRYGKWKSFHKFLINELKKSIVYINKGDFKNYLLSLKKITRSMVGLDKNVGLFMDKIVYVTKIKKATKIHEHGISTSRVADLLGIPTWEVMSYLGHTKNFDNSLNKSKSTKDRLNLARSIFNLK